jgi:hypothetical protein
VKGLQLRTDFVNRGDHLPAKAFALASTWILAERDLEVDGGVAVQNGITDRLPKQDISTSRERTGLVARTVFKIDEVVARRLVGSIPTRSRQN